jgi:ubiquinone/menaquinone biosynthesis C-methylase UbiE
MNKSEKSHAILDEKSRKVKTSKIVSILKANYPKLKSATIVDIGTGAGYIAQGLANNSKKVISVDVTDERKVKKGYKFVLVKDERLPFDDNSIDIIISNHVIEHVQDQLLHIQEMHRVLKKGGIIYLATPNKYWLTDPHYRLLFVSWLPRGLAQRYVKAFRGKDWDVYPIQYSKIKTHAQNKFMFKKVVIDIIKSPDQYHLDTFKQIQPIMVRVPYKVLEIFHIFIPTIITVMVKK